MSFNGKPESIFADMEFDLAARPSIFETVEKPVDKSEFLGGGKTSKRDRYKWSHAGRKGEFRDIDKRSLLVDQETYQRDANRAEARSIASDFRWSSFGTLSVAQRGDLLYLFEGQQRWLAAMLRDDVTHVPCMVYRFEDIAEEAQAFLDINTHRKPVSAIDKMRAMLATDDEPSKFLAELLRRSNYKVSRNAPSGARTVKCVSQLLRMSKNSPEILSEVWPFAIEVAGYGYVHERVIESLVWIETWLRANRPKHSLLRSPWRERVIKLGTQGLLKAAASGCVTFSKGGARAWSIGIGEALDKGVRHRLSIGFPEEQ